MKKSILFSCLLSVSMAGFAQEMVGTWSGSLKMPKLRLVFHIENNGDDYSTKMDSPDQGAFGIPMEDTRITESSVVIDAAALGMQYEGSLKGDSIVGSFNQSGMSFPLVLYKNAGEAENLRPQEPVAPFPYKSEEVAFRNEDAGIDLAGTLTLPPDGSEFPAVILISGSGPQNRDEELFGHKPFLLLADQLTRTGIAVLRFDDRGIGKSGGRFDTATTFDFAGDARAAMDYLLKRKEIDKNKIGLLGHSEGGMVATLIAADDPRVAFVVSMAGMALPAREVLLQQQKSLLTAMNLPEEQQKPLIETNEACFNTILATPDTVILKTALLPVFENAWETADPQMKANVSKETFLSDNLKSVVTPWFISFLSLDPKPYLSKVNCPYFALNGEKDIQVIADSNLSAFTEIFKESGNGKLKTKSYPGLNHLFQTCKTGLPNEYGQIKETISPQVLEDIVVWIKQN